MPIFSHSFAGKRVLITGGGKGTGAEIARQFDRDGAIVFVIDREQSLLDELKKENPNIEMICVDLTKWEEAQPAIEKIAPLDHLINNAAVIIGKPIILETKANVDKVLGVNIGGVLCSTQAFMKGNIKAGKERGTTIVNISSISDRFGVWSRAVYSASKAAVTALTKSMALEFGDKNIRVNCVCPGLVENTGMAQELDLEIIQKGSGLFGRAVLKERQLDNVDIANAVMYLSSPLSSMVTGTSLTVDAGTCAGMN